MIVLLLLLVSTASLGFARRLDLGPYHVAFIQNDGIVYSWGENTMAQLGDGTLKDRAQPVKMRKMGGKAVDLCASTGATCLVVDRKVKCAGKVFRNEESPYNVYTKGMNFYPIAVPNSVFAHRVECGSHHVCQLTNRGGMRCFGSNAFGELGRGFASKKKQQFESMAGVKGFAHRGVASASLGEDFTCIITMLGMVKCVGRNYYGTLGDGSLRDQTRFVAVKNLRGNRAVSIASGQHHTCILMANGAVKCFGSNRSGQLSAALADDYMGSALPIPAMGLSTNAAVLACGLASTCTITKNTHRVQCLGNRFERIPAFPTDSRQIALGQSGACVLLGTGEVHCLPMDDYVNELVPVAFPDREEEETATRAPTLPRRLPLRRLAVAQYHSAYIQDNGDVFSWGKNGRGQFGTGKRENSDAPVQMKSVSHALDICSGGMYTCVVVAGGKESAVKCAGRIIDFDDYSKGEYEYETPVQIHGLVGEQIRVECGAHHVCALSNTGGMACFGNGQHGELGGVSAHHRFVAGGVDEYESSGVEQMALGLGFTCILTTTREVKCVGRNVTNEHLLPNTLRMTSVTDVPDGVIAITAGSYHVCVLTNSNGVWCWGSGAYLGHPETYGA